jgi:hypothetical protein
MTADKIYVDASQPATLRYAGGLVECPTVQEAVIARDNLPDNDRHQATIQVKGGQRREAEIALAMKQEAERRAAVIKNMQRLRALRLSQTSKGSASIPR